MNSRTPCVVQCSAVQCKTSIPDRTAPHHNISHRARVGGLVWFPVPPHTTERDEEPTTESYVQACWTTPIHNNARSNPTVAPRPRLFGSQSKVAIGGPAKDIIMTMYTVLPYIRSLLLNGMHACIHPSIHDGTPAKGYIVTVLVDCMVSFRFVSFPLPPHTTERKEEEPPQRATNPTPHQCTLFGKTSSQTISVHTVLRTYARKVTYTSWFL
mmetsp:Transcript_29012/g.68165  ORF Transcript_29012/g.68165 Transcript_29012/m.68165 type:complete len:212 (-) Transcript_29012:46-681(-)